MISFSEIAAARMGKSQSLFITVRVLALGVALFGVLVNIAGYDLGNLWAFSDLPISSFATSTCHFFIEVLPTS